MIIENVTPNEYQILIDIWEVLVRSTHDFLQEGDILSLRPLILEQYFDAVDLTCAKNGNNEILGFCGVYDSNIEMLFISPAFIGKGVGSELLKHAIDIQGADKVDVNEQNVQAIGFYRHRGFEVIGRSPLDGQGRPYPLLHMALKQNP